MTDYVIGSDNIDGSESEYISTIASKLEEAGNSCETLSVGPGNVQSNGQKDTASGKTAVFIVGGSDGGTYQDMVQGISQGYYNYDLCWFAFTSWIGNEWITEDGLKNKALVRAHDDNFSTDTSGFVGKTAVQYFSEHSEQIKMAYGDDAEALAEMILNGGTSDDEGSSTASTIKDALKELLSYWDGEVECYVRGDTCYVHKIAVPRESCDLELIQGVNIITDSISITDYNPDTTNVLIVHSDIMDDIEYREDKLIWRFGEKPEEMNATKWITVTEEVTDTDTDTDTESSSDTDTDSSSDTDTESEEEETTTETTVQQVACETPEEVYEFADKEWAKIKRENGHTIECKVTGGPQWKAGNWVKLTLPLFDESGYMYIKSASQSIGDAWETSLSLVDYPPGFGEYTPPDTESDDTDTESEDTETESTETTE